MLEAALLAGILLSSSAAAPVGPPVVTLYQTGLLEAYCGRVSPAKPDPAVISEIRTRLPEFRRIWEAKGVPLLAAVERKTGRPFRFRETLAVLHACPDMPSWSAPLTVSAARYTIAFGGAGSGPVREALAAGKPIPKLPPQSLDDFVYVLWHELMHRYVQELREELPGGETPIQRKYAAEDETVRAHIHLYAVEQLIWNELGRDAEYARRFKEAKALGYRSHFRAMEIVGAEGAQKILVELRSIRRPSRR